MDYPVFSPGPYKMGTVVKHPDTGALWVAQKDIGFASVPPTNTGYWDPYVEGQPVPQPPQDLTQLSERVGTLENNFNSFATNTTSTLANWSNSFTQFNNRVNEIDQWIENHSDVIAPPPPPPSDGGTGQVRYSAEALGMYPGYDITARLNEVCAAGQYPVILFDQPGEYILSGDVHWNDTVLEMKRKSILKATKKITMHSGLISAGLHQQLFNTNIYLKNFRTMTTYFSWDWYGAKPNAEGFDSTAALQHGANMVIANPTLPRNYRGGSGYYYTSAPIVAYKWLNGDYQFCDIVFSGEYEQWKPSEEYGTWIWNKNGQSFCIGLQKVRGSGVLYVNCRGEAKYEDYYGGYEEMHKSKLHSFTSEYNKAMNKNILDTRFTYNAGVIVDPFANGTVANGAWPASALPPIPAEESNGDTTMNWNRGGGSMGGSSAINIHGVYGMYVCITVGLSPSGITLNAEDITMSQLFFRSNKIGVSVGQDQNKNIIVDHYCSYIVQTTFDSVSHGRGIGAEINVRNGNASNGYQIFNLTTQRFPSTFDNIITEEYARIGTTDHGANPILIKNLKMEVIGNSPRGASIPNSVVKGNNIHFEGGYIRTPSAPSLTRLFFNGRNITFKGTTLEMPPLFPGTLETSNGNARGHFEQVGILAWESLLGANSTSSQNFDPFKNYCLYGDFVISSQMIYPNCLTKVKYSETMYDFSFRIAGVISNRTSGKADFQLKHTDIYKPSRLFFNDYLLTMVEETRVDIEGNEHREKVPVPLGRIEFINDAGQIKLTDVPDSIVEGEYGEIWGNYIRKVQRPFSADVTANDNVLRNVKCIDGEDKFPQIGDRIELDVNFSATGSEPRYITAIDPVARTVTVSSKMSRDVTGCVFAMGDPEIEIHSTVPPTEEGFPNNWILKGTKVKVKGGSEYRTMFSGTKNTPGIFKEI